jgi:hypothetical protein
VQQFAWLVERSTSQERMAIWADDLRFNTLCLALKELLEGKNKSDIPEELKQQLSVIKKKPAIHRIQILSIQILSNR